MRTSLGCRLLHVWLITLDLARRSFCFISHHHHRSSFHTAGGTVLAAKKKGGGAVKKKKNAGGAARKGFGGGKQGKQAKSSVSSDIQNAVTMQRKSLRANPYDPQGWLQLGAWLMKLGEYAEAERAFALGAENCPGKEMLDAALLTLQGHAKVYYHGKREKEPLKPAPSSAWDVYDYVAPEAGWVADPDRHDAQLDRSTGLSLVHASRVPIIDPAECAWAIETAEAHAAANGGWMCDRHASAPTTDMAVKDIPPLLEWFNEKLETTLFPMLAGRFPDFIKDPDDIRVHDAFIVRYDASGQRSLAVHQDESTFSFTIALNDRSEYEGGGTFFEGIRSSGSDEDYLPLALNADAGGVVCFGGKRRHGGEAITSGTRYIIPLFVYLDANKSGNPQGYAVSSIQPERQS